jgi:hypothetical protein
MVWRNEITHQLRNGMSADFCMLIGSGPISSVTIFGQTLIVLNDVEVAVDLMEKRAAMHSSRPKIVFAGEMYCFLFPNNTFLKSSREKSGEHDRGE